MIRVRYSSNLEPEEVWVDEGTRAVAAEPYITLDEGQGGVTKGDIRDVDVRTLADFGPGDEVFMESDDPEDTLDDTDSATEAATRIWWRAVIAAGEP